MKPTKIELTEEELQVAITALSHWRAYLISLGRDDTTVKGLLDRLRMAGGKAESGVKNPLLQ